MTVLRNCFLLLFVLSVPGVAGASDTDTCSYSTDWDEREGACTRLIDSGLIADTALSSALTNRCKARLSAMQYETALEDCDAALGANEENWQAFDIRAVIRLGLGQLPDALDDLDNAERLNADWAPRARVRADTLCAMKRGDDAMIQYRKAIERKAFDTIAWQEHLASTGHYTGGIDGVFGAGSMRALQNWVRETCN